MFLGLLVSSYDFVLYTDKANGLAMSATAKRMELAVEYLAGKLRDNLSGARSGRRYGKHVSSSTTEYPAELTGRLKNGISYEVAIEGSSVVGYLFTGSKSDDYALRLELGFAGTDKLGRKYNQAPRPYLSRVLLEEKEKINSFFAGV